MRLATRVVRKGVEDPEARRTELIAYQLTVAGSCSTIGNPPSRNFATASSFPGFASKRTRSAARTLAAVLSLTAYVILQLLAVCREILNHQIKLSPRMITLCHLLFSFVSFVLFVPSW